MESLIDGLTQQQTEMVNGIIEILLGVRDIQNRTELARIQINKFKKESINFNYGMFLSRLGLDNNEEPIAMDIKTQPTHRIHTESIEATLSNKYNVDLDIYEYPSHIELKRIVVPIESRGKGIGSKVMNDLIKYSNNIKKDIFTTPSSDFGGSKSRLIQFYKSFGFKSNSGSSRDFRSKESMVKLNKINESIRLKSIMNKFKNQH